LLRKKQNKKAKEKRVTPMWELSISQASFHSLSRKYNNIELKVSRRTKPLRSMVCLSVGGVAGDEGVGMEIFFPRN